MTIIDSLHGEYLFKLRIYGTNSFKNKYFIGNYYFLNIKITWWIFKIGTNRKLKLYY